MELNMIKRLENLKPIWFNCIGFGIQEEWMVARNMPINSNLQMEINKTPSGTYLLVIRPPKGNNIVIESENLEQLSTAMEVIQLNIEKDKITGNHGIESISTERIRIGEDNGNRNKKVIEEMQSICRDILASYGITDLDEKTFEDFDDFMNYIRDLFHQHGLPLLGLTFNPKFKELEQIKDTYILTSLDDIRIGGKRLTESREAAKFLI